ncbi:hypothetical protein ASF07_02510 [Frigoribacterium sp. Leaf254]|nr:hypothetical protein ASF07_02510 [Frigoribacterium sp. Leaf254]
MLPVGVDLDDVPEPVLPCVLEAGAHGSADPQVEREVEHGRSRGSRAGDRVVPRAVVHDEDGDAGQLVEDLGDHVGDDVLFVVRGHDDESLRQGR